MKTNVVSATATAPAADDACDAAPAPARAVSVPVAADEASDMLKNNGVEVDLVPKMTTVHSHATSYIFEYLAEAAAFKVANAPPREEIAATTAVSVMSKSSASTMTTVSTCSSIATTPRPARLRLTSKVLPTTVTTPDSPPSPREVASITFLEKMHEDDVPLVDAWIR